MSKFTSLYKYLYAIKIHYSPSHYIEIHCRSCKILAIACLYSVLYQTTWCDYHFCYVLSSSWHSRNVGSRIEWSFALSQALCTWRDALVNFGENAKFKILTIWDSDGSNIWENLKCAWKESMRACLCSIFNLSTVKKYHQDCGAISWSDFPHFFLLQKLNFHIKPWWQPYWAW